MPETNDINAQIAARGARWVAGAHSNLSLDDMRLMCGVQIAAEESISVLASLEAQKFQAPALPESFDWRDNGGVNWITPIRSQGACGSCTAFAVVATMEAMIRIKAGDPNMDIDLSEADLFFCGGGRCKGGGWGIEIALEHARNNGVGLEVAFPYNLATQVCQNVPPACHVGHWRKIINDAQRKTALVEDGPFIARMEVFEDFFDYKSGVYEHVTGVLAGLHAISVVGYNDHDQCWIAKNSWHSNWGEGGFFRIKYNTCEIDTLPSHALTIA